MENEVRLAELEHRIKGLEDKQAVADLLIRYGQVVDDQDADGVRELFTEDARFHSANGLRDGRGIEGVMQHLASRWDIIKTSYHITHGHILDTDQPDEATGVLFSHAEIARDGTPMISTCRYDDRYRRVEADAYVADLITDTPVRVGATARPADLPRPDSASAIR
jgi:3-phenylpropionate/cinnamic acid dioxygenase small subunit